uniref:Glucan endo-1,3-beta-D-glucosidase n=1 Tax=Opuntia streptacantha TaxID=393608 RepID=A0A7C9CBT0_OPUST
MLRRWTPLIQISGSATGVRNQDMPTLASSVASAEQWFVANVEPYVDGIAIPFIAVGNEVIPGEFSESILPAMQNLQTILNNRGLAGMRTTTVLSMQVLASTYPPSGGVFTDAAKPFMGPILEFLSAQGAPLMVNVYPYFAYASDPDHVPLPYAQIIATEPVIRDQGLNYTNLFDAMVDCFVWAIEKSGVADVEIVVSESGWPHDGNGQFTTIDLAKTYNQNFMKHILSNAGTPKRPGAYIEGFIFAMLDENLKPARVEQYFGMFKPNLEPNYNIFS